MITITLTEAEARALSFAASSVCDDIKEYFAHHQERAAFYRALEKLDNPTRPAPRKKGGGK